MLTLAKRLNSLQEKYACGRARAMNISTRDRSCKTG